MKRYILNAVLLSMFTTAMSLYGSGLKPAVPVVKRKPVMKVEYEYSKSGRITARKINGQVQNYKYDKKGQLLGVYDDKGNAIEEYVYDPAGNILKKTIHGKTTTYKYDKANQLVSSECNGKVTNYEYDAAGRLVKEGDKVYSYIGLDKIESVTENGRRLSSFTYHIDGQLAARVSIESSEEFLWDGLALIQRNSTSYVNEPAVTGGNPILADDKVLFNDMLGTTLGVKDDDKIMPNNLTAFGESLKSSLLTENSFFTGKPYIGELGYAFLFRNYRADQGKWQTADPAGYPDGWNNFAYVNNWVMSSIDLLGRDIYHVIDTDSSTGHSAVIVGNEADGYKAYNFGGDGGGYTVGNQKDIAYKTAKDALAALNNGRSSEGEYDKVQKWETDRLHDKLAQDAIKNDMNESYDWLTHNCTDPVEAGLEAAGVKYSTGFTPSSLFNNNLNNAKTLNYNDFKNGKVE